MRSQKHREWCEKNPEYRREYSKRYREENKESIRESQKKWRSSFQANHLYKAQCPTGYYYIGSTSQGIEMRSRSHFGRHGNQKTTLCRHCEEHSLSRKDMQWIVIKEFENPEEMRKAEQKILQELSDDLFLLNDRTVFGEESLAKDRAKQRERMKDPKIRAEKNARASARSRQRRQEDPEYRERERAASREYYRQKSQDPEWRKEQNAKKKEWSRQKSQDPERRKEQNAKQREYYRRKKQEDPEWYEEHRASLNARQREKNADPERRKALRDRQREYRKTEKYAEWKRQRKQKKLLDNQ